MDLLEHQGKTLFAAAGLPVLPSRVAASPAEAEAAAAELGLPVVVKAQVHTGGRGKAGGIRVCRTADQLTTAAADILGMSIRGHVVSQLLVESAAEIEREMYLAISSSRSQHGPVLIFCREGGVDIEAVARRDPSALVRCAVDPLLGLCDYQLRDVVAAADLGGVSAAPAAGAAVDGKAAPDGMAQPGGKAAKQALAAVARTLWRLYREHDATLVEVNPLVITAQGELVCLDSKVTIDDNALYRQPDLQREESLDERERKARAAGLAFVPLDGEIGVIGNGAGLVMSILDQITAAGGSAADFCDIGGGARAEVVAEALEIVTSLPRVRALVMSIFGGITRCDEVARGLLQVLDEAQLDVPVIVRLDGNAAEEGRAILAEARPAGITVAADAAEAVRLAVAAARSDGAGLAQDGAALAQDSAAEGAAGEEDGAATSASAEEDGASQEDGAGSKAGV